MQLRGLQELLCAFKRPPDQLDLTQFIGGQVFSFCSLQKRPNSDEDLRA